MRTCDQNSAVLLYILTPTTHRRVRKNHSSFDSILMLGDLKPLLQGIFLLILGNATAVRQEDVSDTIASEHLDDLLGSIHPVAALI